MSNIFEFLTQSLEVWSLSEFDKIKKMLVSQFEPIYYNSLTKKKLDKILTRLKVL